MDKTTQYEHHRDIERNLKNIFSKDIASIREAVIRFEPDTINSLVPYIGALLQKHIPNITFISNCDFKIGSKNFSYRIKRDTYNQTNLEIIIGPTINFWNQKKYTKKKKVNLFTDNLASAGLTLVKYVEVWVTKEIQGLDAELIKLATFHFQTSYHELVRHIKLFFLTKGHPWAVLDQLLQGRLAAAGIEDIYPEIFLIEADKETKAVKYITTVGKTKLALRLIAKENYESHSPLELIIYMVSYEIPFEQAFAAITATKKKPVHFQLDKALYATSCLQMKLGELALMGNDLVQLQLLVHGKKILFAQYSKKHEDILNNFWDYHRADFCDDCHEHLKPTLKNRIQKVWLKIQPKFYTIREWEFIAFIIRSSHWLERLSHWFNF